MPPLSRDWLNKRVIVKPRFLLIVTLVMAVAVSIALSVKSARIRKLDEEVREIQQLVLEANAHAEELERRLEFTATDAYIEQEARRRFGYMADGEIRFVMEGAEETDMP